MTVRIMQTGFGLPGAGCGLAASIVALVVAAIPADGVAQGSVATDRAALVVLYDATGGAEWSDSTNWKTEAPLHEWHGVTTNDDGRVRRLVFSFNGLAGSMPAELGDLTRLESLVLFAERLTGPIPPELGRLTNLGQLNFQNNQLTGPIPAELGQLENAFSLALDNNEFTGPIPPELGQLANLQWLSIRGNDLSGSIPAALGRLAKLRGLYLDRNALTGRTPLELTNLRNLEFFDVSGNTVCVPSDPAFQAWRAEIEARGSFRGNSCDEHAGDRETLAAFYDATGGPDWTDDTNWKSDEPLYTWYGVTTGGGGRVAGIWLPRNNVTGTLPALLGELTSLKVLELGGNRFSGSIPVEFGNLRHLEKLSLYGPRMAEDDEGLTGPIPTELGNLVELTELDLFGQKLTGPIPAALGNLTKLSTLRLVANRLTGEIPPELGNLTALHWLYLDHNRLTGPVPATLGRLTNLYTLALGGNHLAAAPIPEWVSNLGSLTTLGLQSANVIGPLPRWLENLPQLDHLDLSYNWGLSGPLPAGLNLSHLDRLDIFGSRACAPAAWVPWLNTIDFSGAVCRSDARTVDTAVFYTPAAREAAGGADAIEAVIDLMVAETNQAYDASGVRLRIALVARDEVDYVETGKGGDDLSRFADPSDGQMDGIHVVRDRAGADLAHLLVGESNVGGIAFFGGAFGLSIHNGGGGIFAHELGHNLGLSHDRYELLDQGVGSYPGHGYVNQRAFDPGAPPEKRWRTIMAYSTQCDPGPSCMGLLRFSNPRQTYDGDPLGVPADSDSTGVDGPADAAAVLDATAPAVANLRRDPANRAPVLVGSLPNRTLQAGDAPAVMDVAGAFRDPDGDALSYWATSATPAAARVQVAGAQVSLAPIAVGESTITVSATDAFGSNRTAEQRFVVTVTAAGVFADHPIRPGVTPVRAVHLLQLRARIDEARSGIGLPSFRWQDPVITPGVTPVRLAHLLDLRSALSAAYVAAGRAAPRWTDATPVAGATPIRAVHVMELRAAVMAIE